MKRFNKMRGLCFSPSRIKQTGGSGRKCLWTACKDVGKFPQSHKRESPRGLEWYRVWQGRLRMEKERPAKTWHTGEYTNLLQVLHQTPDECPEILTRIGSSRWLPPTSDQTKAGIKKYCCRFSQWDSSKNTEVNIVSWIEIEKNSRVNEYEVTNG